MLVKPSAILSSISISHGCRSPHAGDIFTSINHNFKFLSIAKSKPKNSKKLLRDSITSVPLLVTALTICSIYGKKKPSQVKSLYFSCFSFKYAIKSSELITSSSSLLTL